jgi:putative transposase
VDGTSHSNSEENRKSSGRSRRESKDALGWFRRICSHDFFRSLKAELGIRERRRVFSLPVTVWLMMVQRLSGGTLADAVSELVAGNGWDLLEPCKRVRQGIISPNTGAYSEARQRVPVQASRRVAEHTFRQLRAAMATEPLRDRLFIVDGSSIRLAHTPALLQQYGAARNQHGDSHWPIMRVVTMHHVVTGMALPPCYGPMYGDGAVGEQQLAEQMLDGLPDRSVLIGDRNFGIFSLMWLAHSRGHDVVVRLQRERAVQLNEELDATGDHRVEWRPSRSDRKSHPELPAAAGLTGRLVIVRGEGASELLYLFTTLAETAGQIAALYKERWNIETDLRSLKEQMKLHSITAKTPDMAASELLLAVAAYNLIRAVMQHAARQAGVEPRRLSYSRSQSCFWPFIRAVSGRCTQHQFQRQWEVLIRAVGQCKLPNRSRPSAPREVWLKRSAFPIRRSQEKTK